MRGAGFGVVRGAARGAQIWRCSAERRHSFFSKEQPSKESMRETNMPRAFMSIASSSIAPTPALLIDLSKSAKSEKGVPAPHMPSRSM